MPAFHHGISAQELNQGILPMRNANISVIGLVVTSTDADATQYPLDIPVLLTGITQDNIDKAGTNGTLRDCLQTIRDIHNPTVVVLRVTDLVDVDSLDILLNCPTLFGLMPKRLGAPNLDTPAVVAKLSTIAKRRRGMVYASPRSTEGAILTDVAAITAYRDTIGDREVCLIDNEWLDTVTGVDMVKTKPIIATALAMRALIDEKYPASFTKSISNIPVPGITGIAQPRTWDLEDPNTEVGYLNANEVTSVIQHEGFRFWGNRTCSSDPRFAFETVTLTAQWMLDTIIWGCFPFIDQPMTVVLVQDIIDSINAKLRATLSKDWLIGASAWYNAEYNNPQDLSQGLLWIDYDYTPVPTLENLGLNQRITDRYLVDFGKLIAQGA